MSFVRELNGNEEEQYDNYLLDASMYARGICCNQLLTIFIKINRYAILVVILSVRGHLVRKFMLAAHDLGMTKGDWTFLDVEIFPVRVYGMYIEESVNYVSHG